MSGWSPLLHLQAILRFWHPFPGLVSMLGPLPILCALFYTCTSGKSFLEGHLYCFYFFTSHPLLTACLSPVPCHRTGTVLTEVSRTDCSFWRGLLSLYLTRYYLTRGDWRHVGVSHLASSRGAAAEHQYAQNSAHTEGPAQRVSSAEAEDHWSVLALQDISSPFLQLS